MNYFTDVTQSMTGEDRRLLGVLQEKGATAVLNALTKRDLQAVSGLSDAIYRKTLTRLVALRFIAYSAEAKDHVLFITRYGASALEALLMPATASRPVQEATAPVAMIGGKAAAWRPQG